MTDLNKTQVLSMMNASLDSGLSFKPQASLSMRSAGSGYVGDLAGQACPSPQTNALSCWHYWRDYYYPTVIRESYPVYVREQAQDKGKKAFEIIKVLKDRKLAKLDKVSDFIDLMDSLINIL